MSKPIPPKKASTPGPHAAVSGGGAGSKKETIAKALANRARDENPTAAGGAMESTNADVQRKYPEPEADEPAGAP